jgi:RNA polymerase sigma-70 factor (ECF subfamily)
LTQEFFLRLLKNKSFAGADRQKGKFRTYLLGALEHLLADEWDKARAEKRGGRVEFISLDDAQCAERNFAQEPDSELTPEQIYDRHWRLTILERSLSRLREEFTKAGKARPFALLKTFLTNEVGPAEYDTVAAQLEMTANSIAVSVHRMRQRYRQLVRDEIAQTVGTVGDVDEEIRALFR